MAVINNRLLIRRITTVVSLKDRHNDVIAFKANCTHSSPPEVRVFTIKEWGSIAFELAEDWALNHKCSGDSSTEDARKAIQAIANANAK
jgi:hypothetical protein